MGHDAIIDIGRKYSHDILCHAEDRVTTSKGNIIRLPSFPNSQRPSIIKRARTNRTATTMRREIITPLKALMNFSRVSIFLTLISQSKIHTDKLASRLVLPFRSLQGERRAAYFRSHIVRRTRSRSSWIIRRPPEGYFV